MATTFSWTTQDNLRIHAVDWPVDHPKAVVGIIHGLGEHVQRYEHVAAFFNARQIAVTGYDRRGHGKSEGKRGHTKNYAAFLDEIGQLLTETESRYPGVPIFLYGHSMGGNLLLNYVLRRHPSIRGAIISAPHIQLSFQPAALMVGMGKLMRNIYPGFTQSNGLAVDQLSRDPQVVEAYQNDPLVHDRLTAITGMAMLESGEWLHQYQGRTEVPLLLMHGGEDGITSPTATAAFAERVEGDLSCKIWDGLYHEIHNEPEQEKVLDFVDQWITQHLTEPASEQG
jgi:alpha-beta hydrolase superfamily lysophospholipase